MSPGGWTGRISVLNGVLRKPLEKVCFRPTKSMSVVAGILEIDQVG